VQSLGRLATAVGHASAVTIGGAVYIVGGLDAAGGSVSTASRIDASRATVTSVSLPVPVGDAASTEVGGAAYLIGGRRGGRAVADVRVVRAR
jgi:hypothetical protein